MLPPSCSQGSFWCRSRQLDKSQLQLTRVGSLLTPPGKLLFPFKHLLHGRVSCACHLLPRAEAEGGHQPPPSEEGSRPRKLNLLQALPSGYEIPCLRPFGSNVQSVVGSPCRSWATFHSAPIAMGIDWRGLNDVNCLLRQEVGELPTPTPPWDETECGFKSSESPKW